MKSKRAAYVSPIGESASEHNRRKRIEPTYASLEKKFAFPEEIARLLIGYRMERSLTQKQLAERLEMTVPEVSRLESGRHSSTMKTVDRIAQVLGKRIQFVDSNNAEESHTERELRVI